MEQKDNRGFKPTDLVTNKQYRAIIILIFYFFVFLALIISVRKLDSKEKSNPEENKTQTNTTSSKIKGFSLIKQSNFNYKYTLNIDDVIYIYEGKKYNKNDSYTLTIGSTKKIYTTIDNFTFERQNNSNVLVDKPYYHIDFFDTNILETILVKAIQKENNIYTITNSNLDKLLGNRIGIDDIEENNILLQYKDETITRIDVDYTNYAKYMGSKVNRVYLTLEYSDFGVVEEFNIKN